MIKELGIYNIFLGVTYYPFTAQLSGTSEILRNI